MVIMKATSPAGLLLICLTLFLPEPLFSVEENIDRSIPEGPASPEITVTSLPPITDQDRIGLKVEIKDPDGIENYSIAVNGAETISMAADKENRPGQSEIHLSTEVVLEAGENKILIQAVNKRGRSHRKEVTVRRTEPESGFTHFLRRSLYFLLKRVFQFL